MDGVRQRAGSSPRILLLIPFHEYCAKMEDFVHFFLTA
jgi:hypothetical protein